MKNLISLVASYTAEPIEEGLQFLFESIGENLNVKFAPYGQVFHQLLEPGDIFGSEQARCNIILLRLDDLLNPSLFGDGTDADFDALTSQLGEDFISAVSAYSQVLSTPLLVIMTPSQDREMQNLAEQFQKQVSTALSECAVLEIHNYSQLADRYPVTDIFNQASDRFGHVPYTDEFFAALASYVCRYVVTLNRPEKKVIVLDCDNTLWSGVCGEEGYDGVRINGGYAYLQSFMLRQLEMGRLLCLASKNLEEDVEKVFRHNSDMIIPWDQLVAWKINWLPKSENLLALAEELNLGLDSFIFIDDNPVEIAEVSSRCPQVLTIQLPDDDQQIPSLLEHVWAFDKHRITAEDKLRTRTYRNNVKRQQLQNDASSFQSFLEKLQLQIDIVPLEGASQVRAAQMTQRTNQFNTTTRRLDEASLLEIVSGERSHGFTVQVRDRFGNYGTVGLMLAHTNEQQLTVSDFLLSCRALGKGVEHQMLVHLAQTAQDQGLTKLVVEFRPSERNAPALQFLQSLECMLDTGTSYGDDYCFSVSSLLNLRFTGSEVAFATNQPSVPNTLLSTANGSVSERRLLDIAIQFSRPSLLLQALSKQIKRRPDLQQPYGKPKIGMEASLAEIWRRVLRLDKIGRHDRFVDLGGDSLLLVKIHSLLLVELRVDIPITTLFKYATVATLAEHLCVGDSADSRLSVARQRGLKGRAVKTSNRQRKLRTLHGR